jgi:hypothetical protein
MRRADQRSDDGYGEEEAAPLRPDRPSPLPVCDSFKPCRKGAFCLAATLIVAVLGVLVMHLFLEIWQASHHVSPKFIVYSLRFIYSHTLEKYVPKSES